ncbi:hypothetical protein RB195_016026 [Necator americanus]|uniref:Uncharacterized protein n=1 Tax=Necator americanus TaxID=51031 RepID=A0ABR1E779_NECAM
MVFSRLEKTPKRNYYNNLVEEFGQGRLEAPLYDRRGRALRIVGAHAPAKTTEENNKDAFYDEINAMMFKIPSQEVLIVGIDANAKTGLGQQSSLLEKWYYPTERTSDNGSRLVN